MSACCEYERERERAEDSFRVREGLVHDGTRSRGVRGKKEEEKEKKSTGNEYS